MDTESYDLVPIDKKLLSDSFRFVKENMTCKVMSYKGSVFGVEPPNFVELEITATDPGFKGDTATNVLKPATVETGAEIKVPLFINVGDRIKIDTRSGEYLERAKG
jgi:elongation factor P